VSRTFFVAGKIHTLGSKRFAIPIEGAFDVFTIKDLKLAVETATGFPAEKARDLQLITSNCSAGPL
jgi:hypothetical protein